MNVFVLNTGRCGSYTFHEACLYIKNFTSGHESRSTILGPERLNYPDNHIEIDNRLSWLTGRLDKKYGDNAYYVHLIRNQEDLVYSFHRRTDLGIMYAYWHGMFLHETVPPTNEVVPDYIETVNTNIELFLRDKTHKMVFSLDNAGEDFKKFWEWIGAEGDLEKALREWEIKHNATPSWM